MLRACLAKIKNKYDVGEWVSEGQIIGYLFINV